MTGVATMSQALAGLDGRDEKMPVLFVGHGSRMNAIEDNRRSRAWAELSATLPRPSAILCVTYAKAVQDDMTPAQLRALRRLVQERFGESQGVRRPCH